MRNLTNKLTHLLGFLVDFFTVDPFVFVNFSILNQLDQNVDENLIIQSTEHGARFSEWKRKCSCKSRGVVSVLSNIITLSVDWKVFSYQLSFSQLFPPAVAHAGSCFLFPNLINYSFIYDQQWTGKKERKCGRILPIVRRVCK